MSNELAPGWILESVRIRGFQGETAHREAGMYFRTEWSAKGRGGLGKRIKSPNFRHRHEAVKYTHDYMSAHFGWCRGTRSFSTRFGNPLFPPATKSEE